MQKRNLPEGKQFRKYIYYNNFNSWKIISFLLIIFALFGWLAFIAIAFLGDK